MYIYIYIYIYIYMYTQICIHIYLDQANDATAQQLCPHLPLGNTPGRESNPYFAVYKQTYIPFSPSISPDLFLYG